MEHNFLPGKSLWAGEDKFTSPAAECRSELGSEKPSATCNKFLEANQKAKAQYELERRFRDFAAKF
jgi:adenosine deaminase